MKKTQTYLIIFVATLLSAVFSGWFFRKPNERTIKELMIAGSEWRKDVKLDYYRMKHPEFLNNSHFDFNYFAAILAFAVVGLVLTWYFRNKSWLQENY